MKIINTVQIRRCRDVLRCEDWRELIETIHTIINDNHNPHHQQWYNHPKRCDQIIPRCREIIIQDCLSDSDERHVLSSRFNDTKLAGEIDLR